MNRLQVLFQICFAVLGASALLTLAAGFVVFEMASGRIRGFLPSKRRFSAEEDETEPSSYEEWSVMSEDGIKLTAFAAVTPSASKWIVFIHGYGASASTMLQFSDLFDRNEYNMLFVDLRGHGRSEGKHTTFGIKECNDIKRWIEEICRNNPQATIVLFGASMGGLVAIKASSLCRNHVQAIITDSAPSDFFATMSRVLSWKVKRLSKLIMLSSAAWMRIILGINIKDASALDEIQSFKKPLLIIHGKNDGIVPVEMAEKLFAYADNPKELLIVDNADHVQSINCDPNLYRKTINDFINRHIR